jgi:hypothetical protein
MANFSAVRSLAEVKGDAESTYASIRAAERGASDHDTAKKAKEILKNNPGARHFVDHQDSYTHKPMRTADDYHKRRVIAKASKNVSDATDTKKKSSDMANTGFKKLGLESANLFDSVPL